MRHLLPICYDWCNIIHPCFKFHKAGYSFWFNIFENAKLYYGSFKKYLHLYEINVVCILPKFMLYRLNK